MSFQQTLRRKVSLEGIGVHSGKRAHLHLSPAPPHHGICFVRVDLPGSPSIPCDYKNIVSTQLATTLGTENGVSVSTVEHLLAALQGLGIDNAIIEVDGPEVPIMDGSSEAFCLAIQSVGVEKQYQARPTLALRRKVEVKVGEKWAFAEPSSRLEILGSIEWDHPAIGYQEFHYKKDLTPFQELSRARTFGFLREVEYLKSKGLARGGSLDNAVVLDQARVLNPEGLRFADEFARHKILDALGDLKLAGVEIQGFIRLHRAGHELHRQLLAEIFRDPNHFEILDGNEHQEKQVSRLQAVLTRGLVASF